MKEALIPPTKHADDRRLMQHKSKKRNKLILHPVDRRPRRKPLKSYKGKQELSSPSRGTYLLEEKKPSKGGKEESVDTVIAW